MEIRLLVLRTGDTKHLTEFLVYSVLRLNITDTAILLIIIQQPLGKLFWKYTH